MDDTSTAVVPIHNLPNLKQGQNGVEVALTIYQIILDVKARLPGLKEVTVSISVVVAAALIFVDYHFSSNKQELLLHIYYLFAFSKELISYYIILLHKLWRIVMDHFFSPGNPGALFKRPANVYSQRVQFS